ncbi:MAG: MarR family transcriptional regulator [Candidatus Binatus sp.]|nr:MarR family transcriptional regulator [Candidatus Binatus sp.]
MKDIHLAIEQLGILSELFEERRASLARDAGVTVEQWRVLEQIETEHFVPSMFARSRESSQAAVSRILGQLLNDGLIEVAIAARDRRHRNYALTKKGRRILRSMREARQAAIDAIWTDFPAAELANFRHFARRLTERIEAYARRESGKTAPDVAPRLAF